MAKNFKAIPAKGQIDPTACWLACLSWWLKAARSTSKSQVDLMGLFGAVWQPDGTIDSTKLKTGIQTHNAIFKMTAETIFPGSLEYWLDGSFPAIIGFKTPAGNGHMNVIYGMDKAAQTVQAMEPWYPNLNVADDGDGPYIDGSGKFTGAHVIRPMSYYSLPLGGEGGLFIGIPQ